MAVFAGREILAALSYHDIFDYPLKESEICKFLIQAPGPKLSSRARSRSAGQPPGKFEASKNKIKDSLKKLLKKEEIFKKGIFYSLPHREEVFETRRKREKFSRKKLAIAYQTVCFLRLIPWIRMIGLTGGLAMENSGENDDIDFLIVTTEKRLWLTRLLAVLILEVLGRRRRADAIKIEEIKDKVCLNMFLDETSLQLNPGRRNLFTAHEVVQLKPIFNRDQTYERFLRANQWAEEYLPNAIKSQNSKLKSQNHNLKLKFIDFLEAFCYRGQIKYMKKKQTSEEISRHFAFFHPRLTAQRVLKMYHERLKEYG